MIELITDKKGREVDPRGHPEGVPHVLTEPGSHVATFPGYADGRVIAPGEPVPHGIPVAEEWMAEVNPADPAPAEA